MRKPWEFLFDDPPSTAATSEPGGQAAPSQEAAPSSLLSQTPVGVGEPSTEGGEAASAQGAEGADPGAVRDAASVFDPAKLTLADGVTLDDAISATFSELLNDDKLTAQERGQKLVDLYTGQVQTMIQKGQEAAVSAWNQLNEQWRSEIRAMPEFSSDLEGTLGATKQALISLGADEKFFAALDLTGAGNNPHIIQMFHKLAKPYIEGSSVGGSRSPASVLEAKLAAMYPSMQPKG